MCAESGAARAHGHHAEVSGLSAAERAALEVVALPVYPALTHARVDTVVDAIAAFYARA